MNSGKVLFGVLTGAVTGAVLGILFAPEKGSAIRKKISKKSKIYTESVKKQFNELLESASKKLDNVKEEMTKTVKGNTAKSKVAEKKIKTDKV